VVWALLLGQMHEAKAFIYGQTIRQCYLKARKVAKTKEGIVGAWGEKIQFRTSKKTKR